MNVAFMVPLQHVGPPLASAVSAWFNVSALATILMRRGHLAPDAALRRSVPRMLLAGLAMVAALLALRDWAFAPLAGLAGLRWLGLGVLVAGGGVAYGIAGQLIGAFDMRQMRRRPRPVPQQG